MPIDPIFSVAGGVVCAEADTGTLACAFPVPCVGYTLKSMGLNATTVNGRRVVLSTDFQQTITGLPLTIADQQIAVDDSSPASLPPGETEAPISPELLDDSRPLVTGLPPVLAFSTATMLPPAGVFTFSLSHPFPLKWMLTLLNGVMLTSLDVTHGLPGLVVAPSGGSWNSPATVVSVTMTAAFMAALGPGAHHFYMTAVSKRGISAFSEVRLVVS